MNNSVHAKLIRELMSQGYSIVVKDGELGTRTTFVGRPNGWIRAVAKVEACGGAFDVEWQGKRCGTVFTDIGNGPDETVTDWSVRYTRCGHEFDEICQRIACP